MTGKLSDLQPKRVFEIFEELCAVPHGSGNTDAVSDYCVEFARARNLDAKKDGFNNVVITKPASKGYEDHEGVILQGHLDMVCEKTKESDHDFKTDGLRLYVEDGFIKAKDTTLGGDDGIAVAIALAVLEDDTLAHPPLTAVFTVDEEIGMLGASAMDMSDLCGKYLLNIDNEEEGVFLTSCAGGIRADVVIPAPGVSVSGAAQCEIVIDGLNGGHSGTEIHRGRANAHKIFGRLLYMLNGNVRYSISGLRGGTMDNAIARSLTANVLVEKEDIGALRDTAQKLVRELREEYRGVDDGIRITVTETETAGNSMMTPKAKEILTFFLMNCPNGVIKMSADIDGLVETSLNCGILEYDEANEEIHVGFAIRSSIESAKMAVYDQIEYLAQFLGCECSGRGNYPGWQYQKDSRLRELFGELYREQTGKEAKFTAIHAGLECGIFAGRLPGLDILSYGPDILDIHTVSERLDIESAARTYELTVNALKRL
ncbi:MAG: aminoacyl-histidine dipeptidase [Alistipes sp.]|nr:aminoacyl-histidine dipeptidase [Alistipes sp.]